MSATTSQQPGKGVEQRFFEPGTILFAAGDRGDDLLIIDEGRVEIFTQRDGAEIRLSTMGPGQIVGLLTCLTNEPRLASARAIEPTFCRVVPNAQVRRTINEKPPWLNVVLKDFSASLMQMNRAYSELSLKVAELEQRTINHLYLGAQMAAAASALAEYVAITQEDTKLVVVDTLLQKLEQVLNLERSVIDRIFKVMVDAGLLRPEIEPERKRQVIKLAGISRLASFPQFVRESKHGKVKKYLKVRFSMKEISVLNGIIRYAQRLGQPGEQPCILNLEDLKSGLSKAFGITFDEADLEKASSLELITKKSDQDTQSIEFKPQTLSRTIACLGTLLGLKLLDEQPEANSMTPPRAEKAA